MRLYDEYLIETRVTGVISIFQSYGYLSKVSKSKSQGHFRENPEVISGVLSALGGETNALAIQILTIFNRFSKLKVPAFAI